MLFPLNFVSPLALALATLVIPLIILYLLKPRPKQVKFPSIMFISQIDKTKKFSSFFRKFIRDPLLLVQLLLLLLLVLAIADPYFLSSKVHNPLTNTVFIFDGSASMQATDVSPNRFEKSKELAQVILKDLHPGSKVSLVFAGKVPWLLMKESNDKVAVEKIIRTLGATDTTSNLEDAILFANDLVATTEKGFTKKIYLFSDFSQVGNVKLGKGISLHEGIEVEFIKINNKGKNVGIISIKGGRFLDERDKYYLTWTVKNFNPGSQEVIADVFLDQELLTSLKKDIPSQETALFYWKGVASLQEHQLKVTLREEDDLSVDNEGYWVLPEIRNYPLLLITNQDSYLAYALDSNPDFSLRVAHPPVIPKIEKNEFAAVILGDFDAGLILPGTFLELKNYLESGGKLLVVASDGLYQSRENTNLRQVLPLNLEKLIPARSVVKKTQEHEILQDVTLNNILLEKYIKTSLKSNESKVLATCKTFPLIVLGEKNQGKIAYVGINPSPHWSNFYLSSSLPVFWFQLVSWLNKENHFSGKNYNSGQHVFLREMPLLLTTPSGRTFNAEELILDEVGIYLANVSNKNLQRISVNLAAESESNIANSLEVETINDPDFNLRPETTSEPDFLLRYILIMVLLFLGGEIILSKRRGLI